MGLEFIDRTVRTSVAAGIVISLVAWTRYGPAPAGAFAAGCAWSLVNILLIRALVGLVFGGQEGRKLRIAVLLAAKAPVLYGAGYVLLSWGTLPVGGLLAGFAWPLAVVTLKAAGRMILGLDRTERAAETAPSASSRASAALGPARAARDRKDG